MKQQSIYKKNLYLTLIESVLTSIGAGFSVPIINVFWNSIGMNQTDIGFTQMMFTIAIVCLDIPMGYIADRFNKKLLNILGDIGVAFAFLGYAFIQDMYMAVFFECMLGIFMAMTNGVDQAFIKYNADKIDPSGKLFKKVNTKTYTYRYISSFTVMLIGGIVSKYSIRLAMGLSFIPYFIGGIIALFIQDYTEKIEVKHKNMLKDMFVNLKNIIKDKQIRTYLLAHIVGKEITHPHIWIFTPLLLMVGVPIEIVSIGWILSEIFKVIGAKVAEKTTELSTALKFSLITVITVFWMSVLVINTNIYTVWVFVLNGFVCGFASGTLTTSLQQKAKQEIQTSVISIASTGARLLYIPLVYVINYLGNIEPQLALVGMMIFFVPVSIFVILNLLKNEKKVLN